MGVQETLFDLLINEQDIETILRESPFENIREEASEFIEEKRKEVTHLEGSERERLYEKTKELNDRSIAGKIGQVPVFLTKIALKTLKIHARFTKCKERLF